MSNLSKIDATTAELIASEILRKEFHCDQVKLFLDIIRECKNKTIEETIQILNQRPDLNHRKILDLCTDIKKRLVN